ncbi:hypothetical protein TVAG_306150 [Trichomonas vaginalis G3]|uniref:DUF4833 domain-containing protein n=1 Tax=Trichomonas vaginalis (strain ATCC PRA-98 / G3) TaxID=412133 RepID=A2DNA6_TRIV3|nr:protein of unknown function (DUF4833) family [Trichomonas vaginalis G3]EAY18094.1 hypothetical protein TVAG_306150 [Trichomonas vaginalis G3]KAI5492371.1 protein of unknown function (DUF4833) family [Trichomonas vaginalis G3]|eukprot:XP_001579080.1 hypothetical protein [Trichomonas vaginalis G3]
MYEDQVRYELFKVTKSENKNYVVYELVMKKDEPEKMETVHAFWIRAAEDGAKRDLKWIEKQMRYGVRIDEVHDDNIKFHVVAISRINLTAIKKDDKYLCKCLINGVDAIIETIYIDVVTSMFVPHVNSITISGKALDDGREVSEVITKA